MRYLLILLIVTFGIYTGADAATFETVRMYTDPELPNPQVKTVVYLDSYSYDLQSTNIQWYIDDVLYEEGIGLTRIHITAPNSDTDLTIRADIASLTTATRVIRPAVVDLLWEANTTIPNWYKGRALPVDESTISAEAIPHIQGISNDALIYNWYKNNKLLSTLSGIGKNSITTTAPGIYNDYNLTVDILDSKGHKLATNGTLIHSIDPEVLLYNVLPLTGITYWNNLQIPSNHNLIEPSFIAIPFYYTTPTDTLLSYNWQITGARYIKNTPDHITLTYITNTPSIEVGISNKQHLLQSASAQYTVQTTQEYNRDTDDRGYESQFGSSDNI